MIKYEQLILTSAVVEIRYERGYRYLDRCGETLIAIEKADPSWKPDKVNPQGGVIRNVKSNLLFGFSSIKMDLTQSDVPNRNVEILARQIGLLCKIVAETLFIDTFSRIGVRFWYLYPTKSLEAGEEILSRLRNYTINKELEQLFDLTITNRSFVTILEKGQKGCRVGLSTVRQTGNSGSLADSDLGPSIPPHKTREDQHRALIQKMRSDREARTSPPFAILLDIDNYEKDPKDVKPDEAVLYYERLMRERVPILLQQVSGG